MEFAEKLKSIRRKAGMSQEKLAEKLGVSRQAVTKWETDAGIPDISNIKAISDLFHISIDELLGTEKEVIISARHLKKAFGSGESEQVIYQDFNIDIYKGDFTVIMGASGAGKSTLMYSLSGMDKPNAGTITFCGTKVTEMSSDELAVFRRKNCGFVFQQIYLIEKMTLMDNVITAGSLTSKNKSDIVSRANKLFDMVHISPATRKKLPSYISGGEAQRAGIVRAAINAPTAIFADEPTGALNSHNSDAVLDVFSMLNAAGQSIIMVTHDKKSALRGNRVVYIKDGMIYGDCSLGAYSADDTKRTEKLESFLAEMGW